MAQPHAHARTVSIGVLGPLTVSIDGRAVAVTAARLRTLLTVLAISAGDPMSFERLAAGVWGEELPNDPRRSVQVYVTRLRQLLGADLIRTVPSGYVLALDPDGVDALRFMKLVSEAALADDIWAERAMLTQALALWRGEPLGDTRSAWREGAEAVRLVDRRLTALERRIDLDLAMRRNDDLINELQGLTQRYPLRERFWAQLMTALHHAGRRAEASAAYQRLNRLLTEEFGIEPSHDMQEVHRHVVSGQAATDQPPARRRVDSPVPRQLPADVGYFVGRSDTLAQLDTLLSRRSGSGPTIAVISAAAGVGKTALAVHWAHRMAIRFPDGQLCVNLRGFDPSDAPMRPGDVIRGFLDALGVPAYRVPTDLQEQVELYRTVMAGRQMLVLLDNARDTDQVRALLPGAVGCLVLITSRKQLGDLVEGNKRHLLNVDVLTDAEAQTLLEVRLGRERVAAQHPAVEEIIERCARLPLALTIVAARAVVHPEFPLAALAGDLREMPGRLDALNGGDPLSDVRAVFTWSYSILPSAAARLFRLLALHPGPDISASAAASLSGLPRERVYPLLTELTSFHMLTEQVPGRYTFHDLLRTYATERAMTQESSAERRAAIRRVLDHYLHTTQAAAEQVSPHGDHPTTQIDPAPGVIPEQIDLHGSPLPWLSTERYVLLAAVSLAVEAGLHGHAYQLAWALGAHLARSGRWQEWAETQHAALSAAERLDDRSELARAHRGIARAFRQLGRLDDAHVHLRHALHLCTDVGDQRGLGYTHTLLGQLFDMRADCPTALAHAQQALDLFRSVDDPRGTAFALNAAGWCHAQLGAYEQGLRLCTEALDLHRRIGDKYGQATTLDSIGYAHHHLGDYHRAITFYERCLALRHDGGERYGEASTLIRIGDTHLALGATMAAGKAWQRALTILEELDDPAADHARARLQRVERAGTSDG